MTSILSPVPLLDPLPLFKMAKGEVIGLENTRDFKLHS